MPAAGLALGSFATVAELARRRRTRGRSISNGSPRRAAAWAGAKAGMAGGALLGIETGPGMVLTAIGGGLVGGVAGYFGGNWIADWLFDD